MMDPQYQAAPTSVADGASGQCRITSDRLLMVESTPVGSSYVPVAAGQTGALLGSGVGRFLSSVLIIPASTSPGAVSISDGGGTPLVIFAGGALSVADLKPFSVPIGMRSATGDWTITTGSNVSAIGVGSF